MSAIAVVTNPRSKHNKKNPQLSRTLAYVLGEEGEVVAPGDLGALAATAARFRDRNVGVVCVNGGDGTLHQVLTALVRAYGEHVPLPQIAILRGGTMNIVADSVGVVRDSEEMLGRVVAAVHAGEALPTTTRRLLRVEFLGEGDPEPLYGFLSGNGIIARFLELYYETPDPSPTDAAVLLARGAASALVGGRLIRRLTAPWHGTVRLDGQPIEGDRWVAVAIGTIEQMGLGFRVFHEVEANPQALQVVGLGSTVGSLALELPSLFRGRGVRRAGHFSRLAETLELHGPEPLQLMIDGDFYPSQAGGVRFSVGPPVTFLRP